MGFLQIERDCHRRREDSSTDTKSLMASYYIVSEASAFSFLLKTYETHSLRKLKIDFFSNGRIEISRLSLMLDILCLKKEKG